MDDCLTVRLIKSDERHESAKTILPQSQFEETDQRTVEKCPSSGVRVKLTPLSKLKQPSRDPLVHKQGCLDPVDHLTSLSAYDLPPYKVAGTVRVSLGPPDESNALSKLESWKGASNLPAAAEAIYGPRPSMTRPKRRRWQLSLVSSSKLKFKPFWRRRVRVIHKWRL